MRYARVVYVREYKVCKPSEESIHRLRGEACFSSTPVSTPLISRLSRSCSLTSLYHVSLQVRVRASAVRGHKHVCTSLLDASAHLVVFLQQLAACTLGPSRQHTQDGVLVKDLGLTVGLYCDTHTHTLMCVLTAPVHWAWFGGTWLGGMQIHASHANIACKHKRVCLCTSQKRVRMYCHVLYVPVAVLPFHAPWRYAEGSSVVATRTPRAAVDAYKAA